MYTVCKMGFSSPVEDQASCTECLIGSYKNTVGFNTCTSCDPGLSTNSEGATSDEQCGMVD